MASLTEHQAADECWSVEPPAPALSRSEVGRDGSRVRADRLERLNRTIENEIIPRLMLAHGGVRTIDEAMGAEATAAQPNEPAAFAELLLGSDRDASRQFIDDLRARGVTLETIFLDLLAPAARHLGELWKQDRCDFVEVTLGLSRLQQLLRDLAPLFERARVCAESGHRVLLLPAPGEQHTFGLHVVEEFFRRAGWEVWVESPESADGVVELISGMWFAVVGLSVSGVRLIDGLAPVIRSIRLNSLNRTIGVMVGGQMFIEAPDLVATVGADAMARDAREAVVKATALVDLAGT